eukprot:TRINITY_DN99330_c0_g1_i1.p2 TRINITY_DN99330_c0_g1~~TRINITY_DN99330_c0_g1_i1.p2  ORF type:complete len:126 (-),score=21.02 TRINITY_DN99330_c0_g1_i1:84-461(-)
MGATQTMLCEHPLIDQDCAMVDATPSIAGHRSSEWTPMQVDTMSNLQDERISPWTRDLVDIEVEQKDGAVNCVCFNEDSKAKLKTVAPKAYLADSPSDNLIVQRGSNRGHSLTDEAGMDEEGRGR